MCTLVAFIHVWPGAPLIVAANRDERLGDDHGREERVRRQLEPLLALGTPPVLDDLAPTMRDHVDGDPLASTCVHVPALGYGTRSSLLLEVESDAGRSRWLWANGPPCTTAYEELNILG
jgi:uncharacterized protein with NRDE domain